MLLTDYYVNYAKMAIIGAILLATYRWELPRVGSWYEASKFLDTCKLPDKLWSVLFYGCLIKHCDQAVTSTVILHEQILLFYHLYRGLSTVLKVTLIMRAYTLHTESPVTCSDHLIWLHDTWMSEQMLNELDDHITLMITDRMTIFLHTSAFV